MHRSVCALSVALGFAVLSGCTPAAAPPVSSAPVPSVPVCEPVDGATPYPCTQADFDALAQQRALYEEAEVVLRRYLAEFNRQEADWQLREMTPELEATTSGTFRDFAEQLIEIDRKDEARRVSDPSPLTWVRAAPDQSAKGSVAALRACVDGSKALYVTKSDAEGKPGTAAEHVFYFARDGQDLKIVTSSSERVPSC